MNSRAFREELRSRLKQNSERVLIRVVPSSTAATLEITGADILARAPELAARCLQSPEGGVVLLLLPHSVELFLLHLGLILQGRLPAILAWPTSRIDTEKYQRNLVHQLRRLPARQLITLPLLAANLASGLPFPATACPIENASKLENSFAIPLRLDLPDSDTLKPTPGCTSADDLFLQFSGGTTGTQKAVVVTASMLTEQLERLRAFLDFTERDGVASWLPMYHDMGLIACLWFPLWHAAPSLQFSATDWLIKPELLFQFMDRYRATFCWLPNFAFSYLTAQRQHMKGPHSLGHVRGWINCSEPIRLRSFREFGKTFVSWGVKEEALLGSYAMAENVFAVTQTSLGDFPNTFPRSGVRHRTVALDQTSFDLLDDVYVSSGRILPGMEVRVISPEESICAEAEPGNIQLRSRCLFGGYWTSDGFVTSSISDEGWYTTGDYGFLAGDDLYVIGRLKDIIIVGGQNIFPEDVELVVNSLDAVYPGRVVAFGINNEEYGTESLAVVAELRGEYDAAKAALLRQEIHRVVLSTIGVAPHYEAVVPERWIVKSTAGKISRRDTRERFARELLNHPRAVGV
jgi:fatty-acyl-CoA synthase